MHQLMGKIIKHYEERPGYWRLRLKAPAIVQEAQPGQFLMVRCTTGLAPLLRRPISIFALYPECGELELYYKIVGEGTRLLSQKAVDDVLDVVGPLGQGYTLIPEAQSIAIVGRGIGVASVFAVAQAARKQGRRVYAFVSARSKDLLLANKELEELGCQVAVATDDGSTGYQGLVTDLLKEKVAQEDIKQIFICGSNRLTRAVAEIARDNGIRAQVSLEEHMACGFGVCSGCVRLIGPPGNKSYKKVCKDGPVFWVEEVVDY
ncbi:Dihydroorotate dehydrogenase B (NAD(+)), electron transfer subunit [Moorella humiferrea]|uniref:dihydroorotate dehydrogenase electron transfer subunit n=1 Tax=Neomoorella humiferrea TaxID=676965 RepID=UPI0030D264F0